MRMAAATASLLSTAVLLSSGCDRPPEPQKEKADPLRRAAFRSFAARDFAERCAGAAQLTRIDSQFEELKQFARSKDAGRSVWLGENDWNAVASFSQRLCGEEVSRPAVRDYARSLDDLARTIAEHQE